MKKSLTLIALVIVLLFTFTGCKKEALDLPLLTDGQEHTQEEKDLIKGLNKEENVLLVGYLYREGMTEGGLGADTIGEAIEIQRKFLVESRAEYKQKLKDLEELDELMDKVMKSDD